MEREIDTFPTPDELWRRLAGQEQLAPEVADRLLTPTYNLSGKHPRYYQEIAINRTVRAILLGDRRVLLTMATGTGKTFVAFQICWKLWSSRWNRTGEHRRPKILYLADRNVLVDDPKDKTFTPFGDARIKIGEGELSYGREMYFAIYQAIAKDERRPGLYREFPRDFFDLIVVDECHRGSARDDSNWREILEYFEPAYQLGMTATPKRQDNIDTYRYFGNPIYTYSLRQGIDDGFLAPYRVHRIITQWDAAGWRPSQGDIDRYGREIPDEVYETPDFERIISLKARTEAVAKHLTAFLKKTDRFAKTIVFCVDQEHADEMRRALNNLNADLVQQYPDYVCRVVSDEGSIGRGHLSRFQDVERATPVILTTSQMLTTGVDMPTCKNVVLLRIINAMTEFKQIIGRGTRVRDDYGKLFFNILDYTGSATRLFADPDVRRRPGGGDRRRTSTSPNRRKRSRRRESLPNRATARCRPMPSRRTAAESSTSTAGRWRLSPTWFTSWTPTAGSFAWCSSPTTRPNRSARSTPAPPISATPGPTRKTAPRSSKRWPSAASTSTSWPSRPTSPTPTPSTCSAISRSTPRCEPGGNGPGVCEPNVRTSGTSTAPRPARSWTSYWRSTRPMARHSSSCPMCWQCRQSPSTAT